MTVQRGILCLLFAGWLATGLYTVKGNEQIVVRRFGRAVRADDGNLVFRHSGLHFDLPFPFSRVDRVNPNEVRTLTIGSMEPRGAALNDPLNTFEAAGQLALLTGDKNILNLQITAEYRIAADRVAEMLFRHAAVERHLKLLIESAAADLVSRSGVDFVHPLGLAELRDLLTRRVQQLAADHRLGLDIQNVTIDAVYPPLRVKAEFLDVSNARNDRQKYINTALAWEEQQLQTADSEAQQILDEAGIWQRSAIEQARGQAVRFERIVDEFEHSADKNGQSRDLIRLMAMQRMYLDTMGDILSRAASKVFLESSNPADLTIFPSDE